MKYIIGLDIGGTKCSVIIAEVSNGINIIDKLVFPTNAARGFEQIKVQIFSSIRDILNKNTLTTTDVSAIGVSCGGPLNSREGIILSPPNLPGWDNIHFTEMLTNEFNIPAYIQNDANACALVEWKLGAGQGSQNMIFLTMGTGFGAGIIAEGVLIRGENDMGGEIGHIRLENDGPIGFGKAGSIEGFCSGRGIGIQAQAFTQQLIYDGQKPVWLKEGIAIPELNTKIIAEYAHKGDKHAKQIFELVGEKLGKALSILIDAFNPEKIVIGSIFVRCENLLRDSMEKVIVREALHRSKNVCTIVPAQTGESLGDLASIITACYELGIDPKSIPAQIEPNITKHYDRLFVRYPALQSSKQDIMFAYYALYRTFRDGGKLLVCGNGGSAADSEHIVGELMKGFYKKRPLDKKIQQLLGEDSKYLQGALPAIALTQHAALNTAFANDVDPEMIFAQQVLGYGRKGDAFFGISTSGNAVNVVKAAKVAKALGLKTIAFTGQTGGKLGEMCDVVIKVDETSIADIQELHLPVYHTLCAMVEEKFFK